MITPNDTFNYTRPDEVAECFDGVVQGDDWSLYEALWRSLEQKPVADDLATIDANIEDIGPADVIGMASLASVWAFFTPEQQARLNEIATANEEMYA